VADIVPAVAIDMTEPDAATGECRHIRNWHQLRAEGFLEKDERIDDPFRAPAPGLLVDEIAACGIAAAVARQNDARRKDEPALAMFQNKMRGNVRAEGANNGKGRQYRIKRALEADQIVAVENASGIGDVDQRPGESKADLREQPIGVGKRRISRGQAAVAKHHHADAFAKLLQSPLIE